MIRYPLGLRLNVLVPVLMEVMGAFEVVYLSLDAVRGHMANRIDYIGLALASRLVLVLMAVASVTLFHWFTRHMWLFTYGFDLVGNSLEVLDAILRRRWVVQLDRVSTVSTFRILGPHGEAATSGYMLEAPDGTSVTLSGALPIINEILQKCAHAETRQLDILRMR